MLRSSSPRARPFFLNRIGCGLPPDEYYLGVLTDADPAQLSDISFLEQLAATAIRITLGEGERKVQEIKMAGGPSHPISWYGTP